MWSSEQLPPSFVHVVCTRPLSKIIIILTNEMSIQWCHLYNFRRQWIPKPKTDMSENFYFQSTFLCLNQVIFAYDFKNFLNFPISVAITVDHTALLYHWMYYYIEDICMHYNNCLSLFLLQTNLFSFKTDRALIMFWKPKGFCTFSDIKFICKFFS